MQIPQNWSEQREAKRRDLLNPSRVARTISPGRRLKNFFPALVFARDLVKNPETFTAPDRTPTATFSVIFVTLLTLKKTFKRISRSFFFMGKSLNPYSTEMVQDQVQGKATPSPPHSYYKFPLKYPNIDPTLSRVLP